jgi:transcriptional regulator with XRE-family HTH domain
MPDNSPVSLNDQLAHRVKTFCAKMGLNQRKLCKLLRIDEAQFSRWLSGQCKFSAETTLRILQLISLTPRDLELKFGKPGKTTAKIMNLQESGRPMRLDTDDPAGVGPSDPEDTLREIDDYHRQAREAIAGYISQVQKATVNKTGATDSPRFSPDNASSRKAGPRSDAYPQ